MFRPLALVAVRQQANQAGHAQPFALARGDELIEHDLRSVGEIAELRLPQSERVRFRKGVAVLEAQHRLFREHGIHHLEARLTFTELIEGNVAILVLLIDQHRMALREGAALAILPG